MYFIFRLSGKCPNVKSRFRDTPGNAFFRLRIDPIPTGDEVFRRGGVYPHKRLNKIAKKIAVNDLIAKTAYVHFP